MIVEVFKYANEYQYDEMVGVCLHRINTIRLIQNVIKIDGMKSLTKAAIVRKLISGKNTVRIPRPDRRAY